MQKSQIAPYTSWHWIQKAAITQQSVMWLSGWDTNALHKWEYTRLRPWHLGILKRALIGWRSARGGSPSPSSIAVIPRDQTSQRSSYVESSCCSHAITCSNEQTQLSWYYWPSYQHNSLVCVSEVIFQKAILLFSVTALVHWYIGVRFVINQAKQSYMLTL